MTTFKTIIPKKIRVNEMVQALIKENLAIGKEMVKDFKATTKTWTGDKPEFEAKTTANYNTASGFPQKIDLTIQPHDPDSEGAKIWQYLNKGTKVRYAIMSKDFKPKTKVSILNSYKGKGKRVFLLKKGSPHARPGIKPRKWDKALAKKWQDDYKKRMADAIAKMVQVSGHEYEQGKPMQTPYGWIRY